MFGKLRVVALVFAVGLAGCGGEEEVDAGAGDAGVRDAGARDAGGRDADAPERDAGPGVDGGIVPFDAGSEPIDFVEPEGADTDPFLDGAAAATGAELAAGAVWRFSSTIGAGGGNEA